MKSPKDHILQIKPRATGAHITSTDKYGFVNMTFNFDSAAGIDYEVDVTKPDGQKVHVLRMSNGQPFEENKTYKVVMNSYRGNGGGELLTKGAGIPRDELEKRIIYKSERDQRYYIMLEMEKTGHISPKANNNWRFIPEEWTTPALERDRKLIFND
jgi:2',3'-cyclic-nucleotide 2'-phosphodiesterase/3'-nucleotidase